MSLNKYGKLFHFCHTKLSTTLPKLGIVLGYFLNKDISFYTVVFKGTKIMVVTIAEVKLHAQGDMGEYQLINVNTQFDDAHIDLDNSFFGSNI